MKRKSDSKKKSTATGSKVDSGCSSKGVNKSSIIKENSIEEYLSRIQSERIQTGDAVSFNFLKTRCKYVSNEQRLRDNSRGILYWMSRDQRVQDNWALLFAQRVALKQKIPLYVCFCLVPKFLDATIRMYGFMLRGLREVRNELDDLKIPFHLLLGEAQSTIPSFVEEHNIDSIVTDFSPLRVPRNWVRVLAESLPQNLPMCQVDAHNIVPVWELDKQEYAARTIRPKINDKLSKYLTQFPAVISHPYNGKAQFQQPNPFQDWDQLMGYLDVDKTVPEVTWAKPGAKSGFEALMNFLKYKLVDFAKNRNNPNIDGCSKLSPWFHFGQISVARCILEANRISSGAVSEGRKSFVEEAVIRRELSDNFCYYNLHYDSIEGASDWAKKTLNDHRKDVRKPLYTPKQLEEALTYDDLWNAAQRQLVQDGKLHGFLRMYWAKKILEWTDTPENALRVAIFLNDKYSLDGRDPNGYVGCMWSICGIHDQGWTERAIFGKIRFMNYEGCKRKFDVKAFVSKYPPKVSIFGRGDSKGSPTKKRKTS